MSERLNEILNETLPKTVEEFSGIMLAYVELMIGGKKTERSEKLMITCFKIGACVLEDALKERLLAFQSDKDCGNTKPRNEDRAVDNQTDPYSVYRDN